MDEEATSSAPLRRDLRNLDVLDDDGLIMADRRYELARGRLLSVFTLSTLTIDRYLGEGI